MHHLAGRPIQNVSRAARISEHPHPAAPTSPRRLLPRLGLRLKPLPLILRSCHPHRPILLPRVWPRRRMPCHINIPQAIRRHRSPTIQTYFLRYDILLRFKPRPAVVQPRIKHRRCFPSGRSRLRPIRPHPGHVHAPIFSNGDMPAPNRPNRHRAPWLAIDPHRVAPGCSPIDRFRIKQVPPGLGSLVVKQMDGPPLVHGQLRLDPPFRHAN